MINWGIPSSALSKIYYTDENNNHQRPKPQPARQT